MASLHHQSPGKENLFPRLARFLYFLPFCFFGFLRSLLGRTDGRTDIWCWLVFLFCFRLFGFTSAAIKEKQKRLIFYISQAYFIPYYSLPPPLRHHFHPPIRIEVSLVGCLCFYFSFELCFILKGWSRRVGGERKKKKRKTPTKITKG
jgi:hypothetical protein